MSKRIDVIAVLTIFFLTVTVIGFSAAQKSQGRDTDIQSLSHQVHISSNTTAGSSDPETITKFKPIDEENASNISESSTICIKSDRPYSKDDLFYLAAAVCREAGGSSEEVQLLVANVIINRVNSSLFPNTIYGVLTQYKQYGTMWKNGISFPSWANDKIKEQCYNIAKRILNGERYCPENVLFQAEFKQGTGVYKEFPGYYFCYC